MNGAAILFAVLIMAGGTTLVGALVIAALAIAVRLIFADLAEPAGVAEPR